MPDIKRYGFILMGSDYTSSKHNAELDSGAFYTKVVAVSTVEEACETATQFVEDGMEIIELCGAFGKENADKVIAAVDSDIPVGYVEYSENELNKLNTFLDK